MSAFPEIEEEFETKKAAAINIAARKLLGRIVGPTADPKDSLETVSKHIAEVRANLLQLEYLEDLLVSELPPLEQDDAAERIKRSRAKA